MNDEEPNPDVLVAKLIAAAVVVLLFACMIALALLVVSVN